MEKDNVKHGKPLVIGGALREKLKAKIKEMIRQQMKEISASGAAGGSPADGSAGPPKVPNWGGKVKDPTTGLDGYKQVGKNDTGTITEKKKKGEGDEAPTKKKSSGTPYTSAKVLPPEERVKKLKDAAKEAETAAHAASAAAKKVTDIASAREKAIRLTPKKPADNS